MTEPRKALSTFSWHKLPPELRVAQPPRRITMDGREAFLLTRYREVREALADPRLANGHVHARRQGMRTPLGGLMDDTMLAADPPEHTRLRRVVSRAFTVRRVESMRPRIQEITDDVLNTLAPRGRAEIVDDLAFPIPMRVICELLGVPRAEQQYFREVADATMWPGDAPDARERSLEAGDELYRYMETLVDSKRDDPGDDLLSALISAEEDDRLTEAETVSTGRLLLNAGYETTMTFLSNAVLVLLSNPAELAKLRLDPSLMKQAVEELLRFRGPGTINVRFARQDVEIDGVRIPEGAFIILDLDAAHADPQAFEAGDRLRVDREMSPQVQFGHGIHHCLGAPLARLEGQVVLGSLLRRFPDLRLAMKPEDARYHQDRGLRNLVEVPVEFTPS